MEIVYNHIYRILRIVLFKYLFAFRDPRNSTYSENMMCNSESSAQWNQEGVLASYSLFRGFLNAVDAEDSTCSQFFICEGSYEAAKFGWTGTSLAKVARYCSGTRLLDLDIDILCDTNIWTFSL